MTDNEAKQWLKHTRAYQHKCDNCEYIDIKGACNEECKDFYDMAIQALEEIQQYRAIGTVEEIMGMLFSTEQEHDEVLKYRAIGTVEEFEELLEYRAIGSVDRIKGSIETNYVLLHAYEEIGTIEEFKALKEKNTPKKPILNNPKIDEFYVKEAKLCPACHSYINDCSGDYCRDCGQRIDWKE